MRMGWDSTKTLSSSKGSKFLSRWTHLITENGRSSPTSAFPADRRFYEGYGGVRRADCSTHQTFTNRLPRCTDCDKDFKNKEIG
ncbi:hypothetical protein TNCV_3576721 [Trichonephila clavipes]|uniref:Uncharacterized protein n=1 Tax=Trichonephila clavipes TaxID=2585209 RepID=A0A8X6RMB1_TRICX|nr:hypothetical protein TNCV_3576721 [Trichonephila clavipes]